MRMENRRSYDLLVEFLSLSHQMGIEYRNVISFLIANCMDHMSDATLHVTFTREARL